MRQIYTLCLFIGGYRISFIFHSIFILQLLRETPPDGEKFAKAVEVTTLFSKWSKLFYSTQVWTSNFFYVEIISPNDFLLWFAQHILEREENWISWKNEGCPTFIKERYKIKLVWKFCTSFVEKKSDRSFVNCLSSRVCIFFTTILQRFFYKFSDFTSPTKT